jgi:CDP-6-deoxy-D-xylo-4-hexulose-3-dehydrase
LFIAARDKNWMGLYEAFQKYQNYFMLPKATSHAKPCWFGFPLTVKPEAPFSRDQIVAFLEENQIATRSLFTGNIVRHPAFAEARYRVHGNLEQTDTIMKDTFWIGVYPGISTEMLDFMIAKVDEFVKAFR